MENSMLYRSYFGSWGRDLSDGEFAQALAALGVIQRSFIGDDSSPVNERLDRAAGDLVHPVAWRLVRFFMPSIGEMPEIAASDLATGWQMSRLPGSVRLEVDRSSRFTVGVDSQAMLPWVISELSRAEVKARSVYLRVDRPSVEVGWQWPMRVGFLNDEDSTELAARLAEVVEGEKWMTPLVRIVDAEKGRGCDMLLLPADLRPSLALAASLSAAIRADFVVVLGKPEGDATHWYRMLEGLRATLRTSGVAIARVPQDDAQSWFASVIREVSHNNPVDVALFNCAREMRLHQPFISAARLLVDFSRVSRQMRRTATKLRRPGTKNLGIEVRSGSASESTLGVGTGMHSLDEIGERLEERAEMAESAGDPGPFMHETGAATGAVEIAEAAEMATAAAPSDVAEERFIQARVFDNTVPENPLVRLRSFRAAAHHRILVRIGSPDAEWLATSTGHFFPLASLPQEQDEWELRIVLSVAQSPDAPQLSRVILPRFGNSTEAEFFLFVPDGWTRVDARITVLHENRVIQTATINASVTGAAEETGKMLLIPEPEVVARASFDNLGLRQRFRTALVLNHSNDGVAGVMGVSDDKVARFTPGPSMLNELSNIDSLLDDVARNPIDFMGDLKAKPVVDLLRKLARHGSLLYDHIVKDGGLDDIGLDDDGPLQVISAVADARLPIELVYSRKAPKTTARLCPRAAASLRKGKCDAACSKPGVEANFVCPLAFWGVQRVIERHAHNPKLAKVLAGSAFAVLSEPTESRNSLDLRKGGLVAGSQRVEKAVAGGLGEICELIGKFTGSTLQPVSTWSKWAASVRKSGPPLLVLIVHTEESPEDETIPRMEIGKAQWLPSADINEEHVVKKDSPPPLVLLLGCETGVPEKQFADFVNRIRNCGAAIIVATGAKIHSVHAVPVAREFVDRIQKVDDADATFGEIMRAVRREMLADGMPMVLTLTAFGDADWRLAKHS